jgi:phosphoserine phosphatase
MENIATLVGPSGKLDAPLIATLRNALTGAGATAGEPVWLDPGAAADLPFAGLDPAAATIAVHAALGSRPIDVIAQPAADRRKRLLVADMDATIVTGETLDELADIAGIGAQVAAITARAMNGEIDFAAALRERVSLLYGLPASVLEQVLPRLALTSGAKALVATMRANGGYAVLVSGGFGFFTAKVKALCGFDEDHANTLEIRDGRLTGRVIEPIRGRAFKRDTLLATASRLGIAPDLALAVGDGANDLEMLLTAGLGIAFHAKPSVAAAARARIEHGDLTALLFAQGYRKSEFVG